MLHKGDFEFRRLAFSVVKIEPTQARIIKYERMKKGSVIISSTIGEEI